MRFTVTRGFHHYLTDTTDIYVSNISCWAPRDVAQTVVAPALAFILEFHKPRGRLSAIGALQFPFC